MLQRSAGQFPGRPRSKKLFYSRMLRGGGVVDRGHCQVVNLFNCKEAISLALGPGLFESGDERGALRFQIFQKPQPGQG